MTAEQGKGLCELIKIYDDVLDVEVCEQIIDLFESDQDGQFRRSRQNNWIEYIITRSQLKAWREVEHLFVDNMTRYLQDYSVATGAKLFGRQGERAFEHLKIKKYRAGQPTPDHFPRHYDAFDHKTCVRIVGFLWYLNTVSEGGETVFPNLEMTVAPVAGRLAIFPPMWMYEHKGKPPVSNDKYIVTSYLNFRDLEDDFRFPYPLR